MSENSHTDTVHQAHHQYTRDREKTIKDPERNKNPTKARKYNIRLHISNNGRKITSNSKEPKKKKT